VCFLTFRGKSIKVLVQAMLRNSNFSFYFDLFKSPTFEIVYFFLCCSPYILCQVIVASDSLFMACGLFICSYFKTLQKNLENLTPSDGNSKINDIVDDHKKILKLFEDLNKAFAPILIQKCLTTAILICVLGFQLLVVSFLEKLLKAFS
jgi:hypothetical protein